MSHKSTMTSEMHDIELIKDAATALGLRIEEDASVSFYSGSAKGTAIYLKGWRYPVVIGTDGKVSYDNYNGRWGDIAELNKLKQRYSVAAIERAVLQSRGRQVITKVEKQGNKQVITIRERW